MLSDMSEKGEGFFHFALRMSKQHQQYFDERNLPPELKNNFIKLAGESWKQAEELKSGENEAFEAYLQRYFSQKL